MRVLTIIVLAACAVSPSLAGILGTRHFGSIEEVNNYVIDGYDFIAHGDSAKVSMTVPDSGDYAEQALPAGLWQSGQPHAFRVTFDANTGLAGITFDDTYTVEAPVALNSGANGLLITAFVDGANRTVTVDNLRIMQLVGGLPVFYPPIGSPPIPDAATAPATDFLLIETDLVLADGFQLGGQVTFTWEGSQPPPLEQWFEVTPVVIPEPGASMLLILGPGVYWLTRRR